MGGLTYLTGRRQVHGTTRPFDNVADAYERGPRVDAEHVRQYTAEPPEAERRPPDVAVPEDNARECDLWVDNVNEFELSALAEEAQLRLNSFGRITCIDHDIGRPNTGRKSILVYAKDVDAVTALYYHATGFLRGIRKAMAS